jgi:hypothetical protein
VRRVRSRSPPLGTDDLYSPAPARLLHIGERDAGVAWASDAEPVGRETPGVFCKYVAL